MGLADPLETRHSHIWSFWVKRYRRTYGDPPENLVPRVSPFKVTQGHRNEHGSIGYLWLPVSGL